VACAILSQILAQKTNYESYQVLFTAGLLHDLGKLVLSTFVSDEFDQIKSLVNSKGCSFLEAERAVIGMDHAEVGGQVAEYWKFPKVISEAITLHHKPELLGPGNALAAIIHLADVGCLLMGIGAGADGLGYRAYDQVMNQLGLKAKDFEKALSILHEELAKAEELIRVV
jgi:putative nucleotidyltransferase with HDIG domain